MSTYENVEKNVVGISRSLLTLYPILAVVFLVLLKIWKIN